MTRLAKPLDIEHEFVEYRLWHESGYSQLVGENRDSPHNRFSTILTLIHKPAT